MEVTPNQAALVITPQPLTLNGQRVLMPEAAALLPGETLLEFLGRHDVMPGQQWIATIDGVQVLEANWSRVRPKHGHLIEVRRVMHKDVLRLVAVVALSYFTMGAGGIGGGSFLGLTGATGYIAAGAAFIAGSMIINKMLAPKMAGKPEQAAANPTYSLSGGRNRMRPYEPMGLVLGEPYAVPDLAAQPYTYFASGEQYLWQMFHLGINCADVTNLRIGLTPISGYQGVTVTRNGLASGNSDFPALGTSVDSTAGALLETGVYVYRTSSPDTVSLAIDLVTSLYQISDDGAFQGLSVEVIALYRNLAGGDWVGFTPAVADVPAVIEMVPVTLGQDEGGITPIVAEYPRVIVPAIQGHPEGVVRMTHSSQTPHRQTVQVNVPAGQYEVRVVKVQEDVTGTNGSNAIEWVQLRSYQQDTADYDGQARLGIRMQASGQLNGALDEVNCQLRAKPMDFWDGTDWVTATDRASGLSNPGAQILMLARGIYNDAGRLMAGLGFDDSQINIEVLKRFMVHCTEHGFEFDLFVQEAMSIGELLDAIAYAGMGEISWPDGKLGVTFYSRDDPIKGVINMGTIKARSFEVDYATMPTADEIEARYFDRVRGNEWKPIRVKALDVDMPRSTASLQLVGVTNEDQAATLTRFAMAQNIYQRKTVSLEMDLEYMTYRKGSIVALSHDLTQWGYSGRLQACEDVGGTITLTLDERAPADNPTGGPNTRYIGLRLPGETQMRVFPVAAFVGESRTVTLVGAWPVGVPLPGSSPENPAHDTLWIYDFKAVPGERLMVTSIEPNANGARLTLVPISDEFWDFVETGEYTPPPNNSLLQPAPEVVSVVPSEQLARQGNTYYTELALSFEATGAFERAELWGARGPGEVAPPLSLLDTTQSQTLRWQGGLDERWHLEIRLYGQVRASVPYALIIDVLGLRVPPPDVTELVINGNVASWPAVDVPDLAGYLLRFQYGDNTWWETAVPMHTGIITESPYELTRRPQGDVTVMIKAVDTTGNESVNAAAFRYGFSEIVVKNPVVILEQDPDFLGDITNGEVSGGDLVADDLDFFYEPADGPMYTPETEPMYGTSQYAQMVYEFSVNSTEAGILVLQYTVSAESLLIEYQTGGSDPMYEPSADPMYQPVDELIYGGLGSWAVWPGSLDFDGKSEIRFRLTLSAGLTQGVIYELAALIDAPEISETLSDVVVAPGGTQLALANTYRVIRSVQLTVQDDGGTAVNARVLDKNPAGPLIGTFNSSDVSVSGLVDVEIRGY